MLICKLNVNTLIRKFKININHYLLETIMQVDRILPYKRKLDFHGTVFDKIYLISLSSTGHNIYITQ